MSASSETRKAQPGPPSVSLGFSGSLPPSLQPFSSKPKAAAPTRPARPLVRVPPRLYYRWVDGAGSTHFADSPPSDGSPFRTIRGLP
ncbi:MAG: DUF4124 domain-containing protein [Vicinamibacteria bacterium]